MWTRITPNTDTFYAATSSSTQFVYENSDQDYLNDISFEYENIKRKETPPNEKLTKYFQDLTWNNTKPEKIENLLKNALSL